MKIQRLTWWRRLARRWRYRHDERVDVTDSFAYVITDAEGRGVRIWSRRSDHERPVMTIDGTDVEVVC